MRQFGIPQRISTIRPTLLVLTTIAMILLPGAASAQAKRYPLESAERLRFHNVTVEGAVLHGKRGLQARSPKRLSVASSACSNMLKGWSGSRDLTSQVE